MLLKIPTPQLEAFVVWVPELGARENNVAGGTVLVPDPRASHYWDPNETLGIEYGRLLPTPHAAWDVYMLFGALADWPMSGVPKPGYWMQQLAGVTAAPKLDGDTFAHEASKMLAQIGR